MSWAEVKKINSNMQMPLDTLIEKNNTQTINTLGTISTNVNTINTRTNTMNNTLNTVNTRTAKIKNVASIQKATLEHSGGIKDEITTTITGSGLLYAVSFYCSSGYSGSTYTYCDVVLDGISHRSNASQGTNSGSGFYYLQFMHRGLGWRRLTDIDHVPTLNLYFEREFKITNFRSHTSPHIYSSFSYALIK